MLGLVFGVSEAVMSGLNFSGISKANCAEVLRFSTEINIMQFLNNLVEAYFTCIHSQ